MSNDIQKYRYLIENIILDESFKDAERLFTDASGNEKEVSSYIALFKELAKRNKIQGMEKDISRWIKSGWDEFKKFVDSKKEVQSKSEVQSIQKKDSIRVYQDEEKIVVIPLTKEASIHYGKNTRWCTAFAKSQNHFINYFYINEITLFYVLFKNGDKYACSFQPSRSDTKKCFDQEDRDISFNEFSKVTGISENDIHEWYSSNKGVIMKAQDVNNLDEESQIELVKDDVNNISRVKKPSEAVQLAAVQKHGGAIEHIINNGIEPSEAVQLAAVQNDGTAIVYIINNDIEPSEAVQLATVQNYGSGIEDIINKGIEPSEAVQLAAVKRSKYAIQYIDNPSEQVQLAAVQNDGSVIGNIIKKGISPSEAVQLAAVQNYDRAIEHIDNPSEEVQLAAVKRSKYAIQYIDNPSEQVQLAAVQNDGSVIGNIIKKGIEPSETIQLAAVQNCDYAIRYIDNPNEKVKALHMKLYG